jgi:hypothetical protein
MSLSGQAVSVGRDGTADKPTHGEDSSVLTIQIAPAPRVGAKEAPDNDQRAVHPLMCTTGPGLTGAFPHPYRQFDAPRGVL